MSVFSSLEFMWNFVRKYTPLSAILTDAGFSTLIAQITYMRDSNKFVTK